MPENATETSGPSLEQILWRSMDRVREGPAVLDAEEFAEHIAHAFDLAVPEEAFAERFFHADDKLHRAPATLAEAVARRAKQRLHVYEFDLDSLEYVIVEDEDKLVVVSGFGQFAVANEDAVRRALDAAVVKAPARAGRPRAYFVRKGGEVVGVDANQVARALDRLALRQVFAPAVAEPARRLAVFHPVRRVMSAAKEEQALRQDPRLLRPLRAPPPSPEAPGMDAPRARSAVEGAAQDPTARRDGLLARTLQSAAPPSALFLLLPDGSMAHARIGAAHRWEQMLAERARAVAQTVTVEAGDVVVIVDGVIRGSPGERALAQGEALAAVRSANVPVRALAGDRVARELLSGARVVPAVGEGDRYWVHPERAFRPDDAEPPQKIVVAAPLELGRVTGDPWADWELSVSGARMQRALPAIAGPAGAELAGAPVEPPGGTILGSEAVEPVRLAAPERPDAPVALRTPFDPLPRCGAIPITSLQALQIGLERTAAVGAYRFPLVRPGSAPDAVEPRTALGLDAGDGRSGSVPFAGAVGATGQTEKLVLSMPFPNRGELHVGQDLTAALDTLLAAPLAPVRPAVPAPLVAPQSRAVVFSTADSVDEAPRAGSLRLRGPDRAPPTPDSYGKVHGEALQAARRAIVTLDLPAVQPLLGGDPSISGLPFLLRRAVAQSEDWTLAAGLPAGVRELAVRAPFAADLDLHAEPVRRAPTPGEEEILIPLPLWAQMGRGALGETDRIMAAPLAPAGYVPPLGAYHLVAPGGGPIDLSGSAAPDAPIVEVSGPTSLRVAPQPSGPVTATTLGGRYFLAKVPLDPSGSPATARGRIRIGEPLQGSDLPALVSAARELRAAEAQPQAELPAPAPAQATGGIGTDWPTAIKPVQLPRASRAAPVPSEPRFISGLPPGMWSGQRPVSTADDRLWTYGFTHRNQPQSVGGVQLSALSRPVYPQLPIALRFRFAAAPLWWSGGARDATHELDEASTPSGALRAGLSAGNTAAALWRSILVAGAPQDAVVSTMDAGRDASAQAMSSVSRRLAAMPAQPAVSAAPAYIAMSRSGAAGAVPATAAARAQEQSVEMSIVAALPPAPPPLESMSSATRGAEAPHARGRAQPQQDAQGHPKESEDAVSHSKIEGSVDAIAQRIYHRIRRRIQSDRERFGG